MINSVSSNYQVHQALKQTAKNQGYSGVAGNTGNSSNAVRHNMPVTNSTVHTTFTEQRKEYLQLREEIDNFFKDFHSGNASVNDLNALFKRSFATMQRLNAEAGVTNESLNDSSQSLDSFILGYLTGLFGGTALDAAKKVMQQEGQRLAQLHGVSGEPGVNWNFFDAKFYFQTVTAQNAIIDVARTLANEHGVPSRPFGFPISPMRSLAPDENFFNGVTPTPDFTFLHLISTDTKITTGSLIGVNHPLHLKAEREANELFGNDLEAMREFFFRRLYELIQNEWMARMTGVGMSSERARAILEETEEVKDIELRKLLIMRRISQENDELVARMIDIGLPNDWRQNAANNAYNDNFQYSS